MFKKSPESIISTTLRTTGSVFLNSGIENLAATLGVSIEREPAEDGSCVFLIAHVGDVEIVQVDDADAPEANE